MLMKISKTILSVLVVCVLVGGVLGIRTARGKIAAEPAAALLTAPKAMGNVAAKVRVIEFIDYQCPSCAKSAYFLHELAVLHPQDLYVEVKYYPLRGHAHGMETAKMVECSRAQGKFWEAHRAVFLSQPAWRDLADAKPALDQVLQAAGVDTAAVDRCTADPAIEQRIMAERQEGEKLGLKSTPTFYINGTMVVGFVAMSEEMKKFFPDAATIQVPADNTAPAAPSASMPPQNV